MKNVSQAKKYFVPERSGVASDYYFLENARGLWTGKLAERLGLSGVIQQDHFDRMCDHLHPFLDQPLTARRNANRRIGTDVSLSVPKSVSMLAVMNKDERIFALLRDAATKTLALMEEHAATRVRKGNQNTDRITGEWAVAMFTHTTSRPTQKHGPADVQLHLHAFVQNCTLCHEERQYKALDLGRVIRDATFYEAVFHSEIAMGLETMGIAVERRGLEAVGYEARCVTRAMIEKFSNRTKQIEAYAREHGITDPKVKDKVGGYTRLAKGDEWTPQELLRNWWARLTPDEVHRMETASHWGQVASMSPRQALDAAIEHCFERNSVIHDRVLMTEALKRGVGSVTLESVTQALEERRWLGHQDESGRRWLTTPEMIRLEESMIGRVRKGRGRCDPLGNWDRIDTGKLPVKLDEFQHRAASQLLDSTDTCAVLLGKAGVGKTTLMHAVVAGIKANSKNVIPLAPSADASRGVQRREGFKGAETVAAFLDQPELQAKARGQVIWCDEASLLGTRDMERLLQVAAKQRARLIVSGDLAQHRAVSSGDALRLIVEQTGVRPVKLANIRRQTGAYRKAVKELSDGQVDKAWRTLEQMGAVVDIEDDRRRHHELAREYAGSLREGQSVLAIAPTHAEGRRVTEHIRNHLKVQGVVAGPERDVVYQRNLHWTTDQKKNVAGYEPGQTVFFHKSAPGIKPGSRFTVVGRRGEQVWVKGDGLTLMPLPRRYAERYSVYRPEVIPVAKGDLLRVTQNSYTLDRKHRLNNGGVYRCVGFDRRGNVKMQAWHEGKAGRRKPQTLTVAKDSGFLNHGVVTTSHAAQGRTVDTVLIAIGAESLPAASYEQFYVSVSRGRHKVRVFTNDVDRVKAVLQTSDERMSAVELKQKQRAAERLAQSRWLRTVRTLREWTSKRPDTPDRRRTRKQRHMKNVRTRHHER